MGDQHDDRSPVAPLADVLITGRLAGRPSRPPDHAAESRALAELARTLAEDPRALLRELAALVLELCRADSAGISIAERGAGPPAFRWPAVAGAWARLAGGSIRVEASPCGVVLARDAPQLFAYPERHFGSPIPEAPTAEALTVPFRVGGRPAGTVWAVVHSPGPAFDAEDLRVLTSLARFAAAGYQALAALDEAEEARGRLEARVRERTGELTRAFEALRASEAKYRTLFEAMDEGFCVVEVLLDAAGRPADYRFLEVNAAFERQAGLTGAAGRRMRELRPDHEAHWFDAYGAVAASGEPRRFVGQAASLGRWFDVYAFRLGEPGERRVAILLADITERRRAEGRQAFLLKLADSLRPLADPGAIQAAACRLLAEQIGASRAYYVEMDEAAGVATVRRDHPRGDSPSLAGRHRIADFGWVIPPMRRGETLVMPDVAASALVPAADRPALAAVGIAAHVNAPLVKDGALVGALCVTEPAPRAWTAAEVALVEETAERTWAAVERARVEAALRDREADLARVQRIGRVGGLDIDVAGGLRSWRSPEYLRLHGIPEGATEETHADWLARVHPDDRAVAERALFSALRSGAPAYESEYRIVRPLDGETRWIQVRAGIERAADGTPLRLVGAHVDVTEQKRMQDALRRGEERLQLALAAARMGIWTLDAESNVQMRDANLNRLLGLEPAEST